MTFPTPWTVDVLHYQPDEDETDDYGNTVETYSDPDPQPVYGWAPGGTFEVNGLQRQVVADLNLYAPSGFPCGPQDRVVVAGLTYSAAGQPEDYDHGPFGFAPGVVVNLNRRNG